MPICDECDSHLETMSGISSKRIGEGESRAEI